MVHWLNEGVGVDSGHKMVHWLTEVGQSQTTHLRTHTPLVCIETVLLLLVISWVDNRFSLTLSGNVHVLYQCITISAIGFAREGRFQ